MKKFLALALIAMLLFSFLALTVSAAGTLGPNEQAVLKVIDDGDSLTINGKTAVFKVPVNYYNQAKAYFVGTAKDITEAQRDEIIGYITDAIKLAKNETLAKPYLVQNDTIDFRSFDYAVKKAILLDGQKACAADGLSLIFNGKHVVITGEDGTVFFDDAPIVKTTGASVDTAAPAIVAALFVLLVAGSAFTAKKAKLF